MPELPGLTGEDAELLEKYYMAEFAGMLRFATYLLSDGGLSETAVQETFLIAARNMDKLRASPEPVGWLYNTLKNVIRQIRRDRQRTLTKFVSLEEAPEPMTEIRETGGIDLTENGDIRLLKLFYVDGYTLKDLAKANKITVNAMKMRLKRARERLKKDEKIINLFKDEK